MKISLGSRPNILLACAPIQNLSTALCVSGSVSAMSPQPPRRIPPVSAPLAGASTASIQKLSTSSHLSEGVTNLCSTHATTYIHLKGHIPHSIRRPPSLRVCLHFFQHANADSSACLSGLAYHTVASLAGPLCCPIHRSHLAD